MSEAGTETLWRRFHGELWRFVRARVESEAAAHDIVQSAYLRAHRHLVAGDLPENPRAWLYQICRNLIVDAHRRSARRAAMEGSLAAEREEASEPLELEEDAFALTARSLPLFIAELGEPYRSALRMVEIEGLTQAEAAARAGVSLSGMKSRVQRGRRQLRESLLRCCEFELDARRRPIDYTPRESCC